MDPRGGSSSTPVDVECSSPRSRPFRFGVALSTHNPRHHHPTGRREPDGGVLFIQCGDVALVAGGALFWWTVYWGLFKLRDTWRLRAIYCDRGRFDSRLGFR